MDMSYSSIALSVIAAYVTYVGYIFLNWVWFTPKKHEKILREQGLSGNPYRFFVGDMMDYANLLKDVLSKPISLSDDNKQRVIPYILHTLKKYGRNSFMWVGVKPRVNITEPELIREVLTKYTTYTKMVHTLDPIIKLLATGVTILEGEEWHTRRRTLNAVFHLEKLKLMTPAFYMSCLDMVNKWEKMISADGSAEVEAHHDLVTLTGDGTSRTLFGSSIEEGRKIFDLINELTVLSIEVMHSVYIPGWRFMPTKRNNRMKRIDREIRGLITEMINSRKREMSTGEESDSNDFLGILLKCNSNENEQLKNKNAALSIREIIDECIQFYFAGQDTTSTLLVWTLVMLSRYPDWQARAREEVLQVFGDNVPDYEGLSHLKVVTMILNEVLRLYPPIYELTKIVQEDTKLGDLYLPAGSQVMLPIIQQHHDPEIWGDDVKEFKPERFSQGVIKATKKQGSFFPFSLGPRMCIGQNFAMLEAKMALSVILQRFSFELSPSYVHAPYPLVTMHPQFGARLIIHKL